MVATPRTCGVIGCDYKTPDGCTLWQTLLGMGTHFRTTHAMPTEDVAQLGSTTMHGGDPEVRRETERRSINPRIIDSRPTEEDHPLTLATPEEDTTSTEEYTAEGHRPPVQDTKGLTTEEDTTACGVIGCDYKTSDEGTRRQTLLGLGTHYRTVHAVPTEDVVRLVNATTRGGDPGPRRKTERRPTNPRATDSRTTKEDRPLALTVPEKDTVSTEKYTAEGNRPPAQETFCLNVEEDNTDVETGDEGDACGTSYYRLDAVMAALITQPVQPASATEPNTAVKTEAVARGTNRCANGHVSGYVNGYVSGHISGYVNGYVNAYINGIVPDDDVYTASTKTEESD